MQAETIVSNSHRARSSQAVHLTALNSYLYLNYFILHVVAATIVLPKPHIAHTAPGSLNLLIARSFASKWSISGLGYPSFSACASEG